MYEKKITISVLSLIFFVECTTTKKLDGTYTNAKSINFKLNDSTRKFEYFLRSEMGVLQYSKGDWQLNNDKLYLKGLTDKNIRTVGIESAINNNVKGSKSQVELHWSSDNVVDKIKSVLVINDNKAYVVPWDTMFTVDYKVEVIQVKSYLSYSGLLSSPPKIDTLYSAKMDIGGSNESKNIVLKFTIHPYDFARVKFSDTLTVRNNRTLYLNKTRLKKIIR